MLVSGSEKTFSTQVYGTPQGVRSNNCYAYARDHYGTQVDHRLQPGELAGSRDDASRSCPVLRRMVLRDGGMYQVAPDAPCRRGFYKTMTFLDRGRDYHWYRQDRDVLYRAARGDTVASIAAAFRVPPAKVSCGTDTLRPGDVVLVRDAGMWSHKRGLATPPLLRDSCGRLIADPRLACRDYGEYNYRQMCGAFCMRNDGPSEVGRQAVGKKTVRRPGPARAWPRAWAGGAAAGARRRA